MQISQARGNEGTLRETSELEMVLEAADLFASRTCRYFPRW